MQNPGSTDPSLQLPSAFPFDACRLASANAQAPFVTDPIFDNRLRSLRRDRAFRRGPVLFLHERAFDDCMERLELVQRQFRSAVLLGCPDQGWRERLAEESNRSMSPIPDISSLQRRPESISSRMIGSPNQAPMIFALLSALSTQ